MEILATTRAAAGRWAQCVLLTVSAYVAGTCLVAPICYWQGRILVRGTKLMPLAWSPDVEPLMWLMILLFVGWTALWSLYLLRQLRLGSGLYMVAPPLGVFVWSALDASVMAYSCNIF